MHHFALARGNWIALQKIGDASVTPINKFQTHHLTSSHKTEMLYNVKQLNEIITEYFV
jgi:hypothetical protein